MAEDSETKPPEALKTAFENLARKVKEVFEVVRSFVERMVFMVKTYVMPALRKIHAHLEWHGDVRVKGHRDRRRLGRYIRQNRYEAWLHYRGVSA